MKRPDQLIAARLAEMSRDSGISLAIVRVEQTKFGPLFFYDSQRHIESGEDADALLGAFPLIYDLALERIDIVKTHPSVAAGLDEYEQRRLTIN